LRGTGKQRSTSVLKHYESPPIKKPHAPNTKKTPTKTHTPPTRLTTNGLECASEDLVAKLKLPASHFAGFKEKNEKEKKTERAERRR